MDPRNDNERRNRWTVGLRMATVFVVLGTLAAVWHPTRLDMSAASHAATVVSDDAATASATGPDMSVYFPDRFPAPAGRDDEPQPPTF